MQTRWTIIEYPCLGNGMDFSTQQKLVWDKFWFQDLMNSIELENLAFIISRISLIIQELQRFYISILHSIQQGTCFVAMLCETI